MSRLLAVLAFTSPWRLRLDNVVDHIIFSRILMAE